MRTPKKPSKAASKPNRGHGSTGTGCGTTPGGGPPFDVTTWYGLFAPRGTPAPVIAKLNKVLNESLADETVRKRLETAGVIVQASTPQAFGDFMTSEYKRWDAVREAASIDKQ